MTDQQALREYAANQNAEAFRILVDQYQRLVYSAASRRLANPADIEDVVQLTFLKLAKAAGAIRRDLAGWLYTTSINTANDLIRRDQTRRRHEALAAPPESFSNDVEKEEWLKLSVLVDEAILELPGAQQTLIVEHFLRGRSQRDLAGQLNVSQPTILRRIDAAVEQLRKRLASRGCTLAAPLLASALAKFPQPSVPKNVTAQLVKVGLSGVSAKSVGTSSLLSASIWMKIGVVILALALVLSCVILLRTPSRRPKAAAAAATAPATAPAIDPADWRGLFENAYALQPNQNLKFIPPPPLPERQEYLLKTENKATPMPFIQWRWIDGNIKREWMQGSGPNGASLASVIGICTGLNGHQISITGFPAINMDGDWIVRDGSSAEDILADLHSILLNQFKVDMQFEKVQVDKDALVATGNYHLRRIPNTTGGLQIYSDVLDHPKAGDPIQGGGTTTPDGLWSILGGFLAIPIVDETKNEPRQISWLLSHSIADADKDPARRQLILDNITKQTGVAFKQEKRTFTTWNFTPATGKDAITTRQSALEK